MFLHYFKFETFFNIVVASGEFHIVSLHTGISERGKARLARSSSLSSNESPTHALSETNKQPVSTTKEEKSTQNQAPKTTSQPKQEVPTANFFETLDWSATETASEQVNEVKIPTEAESSLLGNTSDDEDDFAALTQERVGGGNDRKSPLPSDSGNVQFSEQRNDSKQFEARPENHMASKSEDVDFFNMNSGNNLADNIDLMHIEKTPSNVDLLSGAAGSSGEFDGKGSKKSGDTFDPFHAFSSNAKSQDPPPVTVTAPKNEFHAFDPFGASNGMKSSHDDILGMGSSSSLNKKSATADSSGDLMGDWNEFVSTTSPNISRNSSYSNLGAGGNIPYNSSGTFQPMGGNIPRNNSGTFQGTQMGGNIPKTNSGTFQGMGQNTKPAGSGMSAGKIDPFAEFGESIVKQILSC